MKEKKYLRIDKVIRPKKCKYCKNILRKDNKREICNICDRATPEERMRRRK